MKSCTTCQYRYRPLLSRVFGAGARVECHNPEVNAAADNQQFAVHGQFGIDCLAARRYYCEDGRLHEEKRA